jgi:lipopolysaccharide/colanic/teichoic acid biosynthesis glycosyltransferase
MLKRLIDVTASVLALLVLAPLFLLISLMILVDSPGPVLYRGERVGLNGRIFRIFKFRTMVLDAEKLGGPSTALNDPRLLRFGRLLRRSKIDELPQFINVLRGEMSLVGPRPQVERYTRLYRGEEKIILSVRPGLTDFASLHFIDMDEILGESDVDEKYLKEIEPEKNRLRIKYVKDQSLGTDLRLIFCTIKKMLGI